MTEELTITKILSEEKLLKQKIRELISSESFKFITYCLKNSQYVGPRTKDEQEKFQKEQFQSLSDLLIRLKALRRAHVKANHNTMITVPCEPDLISFVQGKELGTEEISIAEAINRKNNYKGRKNRSDNDLTMSFLADILRKSYQYDLNNKSRFDSMAESAVAEQMERKFPSDSKQSWSMDKYNEEREKERAAVEVLRIDPNGLLENDAINKYYNAINEYIMNIDSIISEANASTKVTVEY